MSREMTVTPSCEISGLPLPILHKEPAQVQALINLYKPDHVVDESLQDNLNHALHPENDPRLKTDEGKAMRDSIVQVVPFFIHNYMYHPAFRGPELLEDKHDIFLFIAKSVAGVTPRQAIDFTGFDRDYSPIWDIVEMNNREHKKVASTIFVSNPKNVSRFLVDHAAEQNIVEIVNDNKKINDLLDMRTPSKRKLEIASGILSLTLMKTFEDAKLIDKHTEWHEQGMIASPKPKPLYSAVKKLVMIRHLSYFQQRLTEELAYD